jgi:hypothetical protein
VTFIIHILICDSQTLNPSFSISILKFSFPCDFETLTCSLAQTFNRSPVINVSNGDSRFSTFFHSLTADLKGLVLFFLLPCRIRFICSLFFWDIFCVVVLLQWVCIFSWFLSLIFGSFAPICYFFFGSLFILKEIYNVGGCKEWLII